MVTVVPCWIELHTTLKSSKNILFHFHYLLNMQKLYKITKNKQPRYFYKFKTSTWLEIFGL